MLPKTKKQRRLEAEARREKKARSLEKRRRLELRERGHVVPERGVVNPEADKTERRLAQTATRGVVRLFNAVSKAQRQSADSASVGAARAAKNRMTKTEFLAELSSSSSSTEQAAKGGGGDAAGAEVREGGEKGKAGASGGWDVLSDGYLMGRNKLKDWDKGAEEGATEVRRRRGRGRSGGRGAGVSARGGARVALGAARVRRARLARRRSSASYLYGTKVFLFRITDATDRREHGSDRRELQLKIFWIFRALFRVFREL